jgi:ABC-type bacteriocin/lantibiotic exporter with double-glycine peptidase domain
MELNKGLITPVQRFWKLLAPDTNDIWNIYVYAIFNGLVNLSLPLGIQAIVNLIQGGQVSTSWIVLLIFVVLGVALSGILQVFQLRITENLQQKVFARTSFELAYRIPRITSEELDKHYAPELMNRFFDTMSVQKGLPKILISFSAAALQVVFGLLLLSVYHPFFLIFSVLLIFLVLAIFRLTARKGLETSLYESKHKYKVAHWLEEIARTITTFKLSGRTILPLQKADVHIKNYLDAREEHFKVLIKQYYLMVGFKVIVVAGLLAIGGILVMEQVMNIGQFVAAEIIILLVIASVEKLIESLETIYDILTSLEKIGQVTDLELENTDGVEFNVVHEGMKVELQNVSFRYPESDIDILNNISLKINSGECLMITGANGSGKSTLMQIISGLYDVKQGNISYNELPKRNINQEDLRAKMGACLNDDLLFESSILDNITLGRDDVSFENVQWAVQNLGLKDYVKALPKGYNTVLNPQGKKMSSSVMQKILLARSIASKPKLLLLEYPFENLDHNEREKIINFLLLPEHQWTIVITSNSYFFASKANKIVLMEKGTIVKTGTFDELKDIINLKD